MRSSASLAGAVLAMTVMTWAQAKGAVDEVAGAELVCRAGPTATLARAARMRGEAAVRAAQVSPNPELVAEHDRILTGKDTRETTIGVGIPLTLSGRRSLLRDAAAARLLASRAEAEETMFEHAVSFRQAFARAVVSHARVGVLEDQQRAIDALAATIQGLAKGGEVAGYDLLRQRSQARLHRRRLQAARAEAAYSTSFVQAWLGAPVALDVELASLAGGAKLLSQTRAARPAAHPRIRRLQARARALAIEATAARRRAVPDVGVLLGYRTVTAAETGHGFRVGLSVPLPLFDHGQGEATRATAEQNTAQALAGQLSREGKAKARATLERLRRLERDVNGAAEAAREASQLRAKAKQLYAAGELTMAELLDAYEAAEEARLANIDLAEQIASTRIALMRAYGTQFDARVDAACGRAR